MPGNELVDEISKHVRLHKQGKLYVGLCPFHNDEKTKSFKVYPDKDYWRCFGCNKWGHLDDFKKLISDPNIKEGRAMKQEKKEAVKKKVNPEILTSVAEFYYQRLKENEQVLKYLTEERRISRVTIDKFKIGYDDGVDLLPYIQEQFPKCDSDKCVRELADSGLIVNYGTQEQARYVQFFNHCITLPFYKGNQAVYMVGKNLDFPEKSDAKYKNLPGEEIVNVFNMDSIEQADKVILTEGIFDAASLIQNGYCAVTMSNINAFPPQAMIDMLYSKEVYICFDSEKNGTGIKAAVSWGQKFLEHGIEVKIIELPLQDGEEKIDVNEFFVKNENAKEIFESLISNARSIYSYISVDGMSLFDFMKVLLRNFPGMWPKIEVSLSAEMTLKIKDCKKPIALIFIGKSSGEKSTVISILDGAKFIVHRSDNFTSASFVSHASNKREETLRDKVDLLPRIRNKVLLTSDLAPLFSQEKERLQSELGILVRVLDGQGYKTDSGVHGSRGYEGEYQFVWIGATVDISMHTWNIMGNLGPRLYFWRITEIQRTDKEYVAILRDKKGYDHRINACREALNKFMIRKMAMGNVVWEKDKESDEVVNMIVKYGELVARMRSTIARLEDDGYGDSMPNHNEVRKEDPKRANQILYDWARGRAWLYDRRSIDESDLTMIREIAFSTAPTRRSQILHELVRNDGKLDTAGVCKATGTSRNVALVDMKVMEIIGVARYYQTGSSHGAEIELVEDMRWLLDEEERRKNEPF
ncbi:MAG: hypothetical protein A2252_04225 [Elusimicrobia bacterium RIFOXYA2_FULL_39_19]|nr:MAG: hypothetical protein A2252_04225 [Elusimicrobia bacterium RIFOXYA2_FULL_39_19]